MRRILETNPWISWSPKDFRMMVALLVNYVTVSNFTVYTDRSLIIWYSTVVSVSQPYNYVSSKMLCIPFIINWGILRWYIITDIQSLEIDLFHLPRTLNSGFLYMLSFDSSVCRSSLKLGQV